ncbi:hypothetical protein AC578_38 [Pseudocercospora eumusae]|uniref:Protein-tyrosine sulfotransferase n=1 Tax=Pseudocercospora eumusae TaxID=321146 RepID=A0A139H491_9PEZI|nr:hypothetical protein AC578_38 [Pseudocercospora eumusae]
MDAYPHAKFILVERDTEAWYPSFFTIIKAVMFSWYTPIVKWYAEPLVGRSNMALGLAHYDFDAWSVDDLEANARLVYKVHREDIFEKAATDGRFLLLYEDGSKCVIFWIVQYQIRHFQE